MCPDSLDGILAVDGLEAVLNPGQMPAPREIAALS
jgi:hypothetical protein